MSLEKDILFAESESDNHKTLINFIYTYYYLVDQMNDKFKKHDITRQQFNLLRILKSLRPHYASVNLLKARMLDKMSDVSRIVERLRVKGLVHRESAARDKRSVEVSISEKGLELLEMMKPEIEVLGKLMSNLTSEETALLNKMLNKIRINDADSVKPDFAEQPSTAPALQRTR